MKRTKRDKFLYNLRKEYLLKANQSCGCYTLADLDGKKQAQVGVMGNEITFYF